MGVQPELAILDELVSVEPGQTARTTVRIRNVSGHVVHYSLSPVVSSPAAPWITIEPDSVRLLESEDGEVDVLIQPPLDSSTSAGRFPFAIMADPGPDDVVLPAVVEADVAVGAVYALDARMIPSHGRGRLRGRLRVEFTNRGNEDVHVTVAASDDADDEKLHFATADGRLTVPADKSAEAFIKVRPDRPTLLGKPVDHPFVVRYQRRASRTARLSGPAASDEVGAEIAGTWTQKPVIAKWMVALAVLLVGLAGLVYVLRRASAVEAVPRAPAVPKLVEAEASNGELDVTFEVADAASTIELQLVEPPVGDDYDLAKQTGDVVKIEVGGSTAVGSAALGEKDGAVDGSVYFRYRAVEADGGSSIWDGNSEVVSDSKVFTPPANVNARWIEDDEVEVSWEPPQNPEGRTLRYALRREDGTALDVLPDGTTARIPVGPQPFGIQVQVFDENDPTARSEWSAAATPPLDERPAPTAFSAPSDVAATWEDSSHVKVTWTAPPDRGDRTLIPEFRDESGNAITADEISGNSAILPMGETVVGIEVRQVNADEPEDRSPWSSAVPPEGERPPATTATTAPARATIDGFYILPQAARGPTAIEKTEWSILWQRPPPLPGVLQTVSSADHDLPDFLDGEFMIAAGFATQEEAAQACGAFLLLLDAASEGNPLSSCWVLQGTALVQDVPPPVAPSTEGT